MHSFLSNNWLYGTNKCKTKSWETKECWINVQGVYTQRQIQAHAYIQKT